MNCTRTRDWLAQNALEPQTPDEGMVAHLAGCAECQRAQAGLEQLARWEPEEPPLGLREQTMRKLQAEPTRELWIDRWVRAVSAWLQSRHPLALAATACVLFAVVLAPNVLRGRAQGALAGCQANLRTLGLALDAYADAHEGHYPASLAQLPVTLPVCPTTDTPTYALTVSPDARSYTVYCAGHHHARADHPQYTSAQGETGP